MARVSIIIPTYNRAAMVPRAIESAKNAETHVETVVVDDALNDGTAAICRRIGEGLGTPEISRSIGESLAFLADGDLR